jgi:arylsulfatase A-like enzyme
MHGARVNGLLLDPRVPTLAEILKDAGFRTAAFVSGYTMEGAYSGLNKGFEIYEDVFAGPRRDGRLTVSLAVRWLAERRQEERFFVLVHLYDAHGPYRPRPAYATLFRSRDPGPLLTRVPPYQKVRGASGAIVASLNPYVDSYDAMIRYLDDQIAELLSHIDLDKTIIVLMSDHGETLGERFHALDHGGQLFDEQSRIALIMKVPRMEPRRIDGAVETLDILPSLLDLLGIALPVAAQVRGVSLVPLLQGKEGGREFVFSEARAISARHADRGYTLDSERRIHSVRSDRWKLIRYPGVDVDFLELYELELDPGETENVAAAFPAIRDSFLGELARWQEGEAEIKLDAPDISPEAVERLRALGYVDP